MSIVLVDILLTGAIILGMYLLFRPYYNTYKVSAYYERLRMGYKIHLYQEGLKSKGIKPEDIMKLVSNIVKGEDKELSDFELDTIKHTSEASTVSDKRGKD